MSEVDKTVAATVGYRLRGGALVEQAGQIKTLATAEMARFKQEQLLDDAAIAELDAAVAKVLAGLHDRTLATGEAHLQTAEQATAMHELKVDRRRLTECVVRAFRHRPELRDFQGGTYHGTTIAAFCTDMNRKLAFAKKYEADLAPVGAGKDLIAKLETKLRAFEAGTGAQEAGIASLPDSNRAFCEAKGRLYFLIKDIISAARALHAAEPEAAAKYNLKVLYRRGNKKEKAEAAASMPAS